MPHQIAYVHALEGAVAECAQLSQAAFEARGRRNGDVLRQHGLQPHPFTGLRIDEEQGAPRAVRVEAVLDVGPHDDAAALAPFPARGAYRPCTVEREKNLDRMMRMRRHLTAGLRDHDKAALP